MESKPPYDFLSSGEWYDSETPEKIGEISPVKMAYLGDALYELAVRLYLIDSFPGTLRKLHGRATELVNAASQSKVIHRLMDSLSDEELDIVRRARNTKTHVPKSATVDQYRYSTALEALFGYLFLTGKRKRLEELLHLTIQMLEKDLTTEDDARDHGR
jgi:ribonuclease-3 family protein